MFLNDATSFDFNTHRIALCEELERRIRRGERLYVFSAEGNGRVGILAALLLSRMYGMHPEDAQVT